MALQKSTTGRGIVPCIHGRSALSSWALSICPKQAEDDEVDGHRGTRADQKQSQGKR